VLDYRPLPYVLI